METKITVIEKGPYLLKGNFTMVEKDGTEKAMENVALCSCGLSTNKPFCTGAHRTMASSEE
jgi:CDGSH-type Zn-finger protein